MTSPLEQCRDALRDVALDLAVAQQAELASSYGALLPRKHAAAARDREAIESALAAADAALAAQNEPVALREQMRGALQQAIIALEELDGPGYLIGGVMHHRIGLLLPMLNDAVNALNAAPVAAPSAQPLTDVVALLHVMCNAAELNPTMLEALPRRLLAVACRIRTNETLHRDDDMVDQAAHALRAAMLFGASTQPIAQKSQHE